MCVLQWVEWSATHTACLKTQCERTKRTLSSPTQVTIEADSLSTKLNTLLRSKAQFEQLNVECSKWIPRRSVSVTAGLTSVHVVALVGGLVFDTHRGHFADESEGRDYVLGEMWMNVPPFGLGMNKTMSDEIA